MRNMIFITNPTEHADDMSSKCQMMYLNRFGIDEDAAFELSGVYTWDHTTEEMANDIWSRKNSEVPYYSKKAKGKGFLVHKEDKI